MSAKSTPFVERLPCQLAPSEIAIRAREMAHKQLERDQLTLEKSLSAQRYAKSIKEVERRVGDLAEQVRNGVEYRDVKVRERKNFEQNVIEVIRCDTDEVCGQRAMKAEERQAEMFPKGAPPDDAQLELGAPNGGELREGPPDEEDDEDFDEDDEDGSELDAAH